MPQAEVLRGAVAPTASGGLPPGPNPIRPTTPYPRPVADGKRGISTLCGHWHAAESKMAGTLSDSEIKSRQLTFSPSITAETETPARQSVSKLGRFMTTWDGLTLRRN